MWNVSYKLERALPGIEYRIRKADENHDVNHNKWKKLTNSGTNFTFTRDVDYAVNWVEHKETSNELSRAVKELEAILRVNRTNTTYKKIDGKGRRALEREPCVICFETHDAKQLTTTTCGHTFCRPCFSKVLDTCYYDDKKLSCPYCRNDKIGLWRYYK
jgi:hypothetical protein